MLTYSRFPDESAAAGYIALLQEAGIPYQLEKDFAYPDKIYFGQPLDTPYSLKLAPRDFKRMNQLLKQKAREDLLRPDPEYYLYSFSPYELKDVLDHPEEWNAYDVALAGLLFEREGGFTPFPQNSTTAMEYTPAAIAPYWLVLGYISCLLFIPALFIGEAIRTARKTLPDGTSVYLYDTRSRNHGSAILFLGAVLTVLFLFRLFFR